MSWMKEQTAENMASGYGEDSIRLLARDPHLLYAYWEITQNSLDSAMEQLGTALWERSAPVLKVTDLTHNESFYIRINEFSDSWYINVSLGNCRYMAEVGRRLPDGLFYSLLSSNEVLTPNDGLSQNTNLCFIEAGGADRRKSMLQKLRQLQGLLHPGQGGAAGVAGMASGYIGQLGPSSSELTGKDLSRLIGISSDSFLKG